MNKVILLLFFAVAIGLTQAQVKPLDELRAKIIDRLTAILKNPLEIFKTLSNVSVFALSEFVDLVKKCLAFAQNTANTFVIFPIQDGMFRLQDLLARTGIRGNSLPRQFKNTTWDYQCVNYKDRGQVSPVKNQKSCGSCYAFGAVASIESQYLIHKGQSVQFAEQEVVDCSQGMYPKERPSLNQGCSHGLSNYAFEYFCEHGLHQTSEYPYVGKKQNCQTQIGQPTDLKFKECLVDNEDHLAYLLNKYGPINVYMCAGSSFMYYAGGVYNDARGCDCQINHSVLVVGLIKDGDQYQWLIKNSWGESWGEGGFIRVVKGCNMCRMISQNVIVASIGEEPVCGNEQLSTPTPAP